MLFQILSKELHGKKPAHESDTLGSDNGDDSSGATKNDGNILSTRPLHSNFHFPLQKTIISA
jgi:hypothetical protein